ncbi:MCE family protein [Rhodococcus erythropolis]|nr:MCE family protein [Rhodococcus erythropolis]MBY6388848.1 MCE family protein [Rhodococcus erythropolis]
MTRRAARIGLAAVLALIVFGGAFVVVRTPASVAKITVTAFFANSNGLFPGDEVRILGVRVGSVEAIAPEPHRAKVTFSFDAKYRVPATAKAVILSPSLVSSRAIQLVPAYTSGATMNSGTVIAQDRTAVPVEWDDFRDQLQKLTQSLQPTQPGGVSPLGSVVNTAADNLRGQGQNIRNAVLQLSDALSALGDHSTDIFSTVRNLSILVSALQTSTGLMADLNGNLAAVTGLLADGPDEIADAVTHLNTAVGDVQSFVADHRPALGITFDKLASISQALVESLDDIKQTLHIAPTMLSNFVNIYQPAQGALTGILALNNFADPLGFLCGAIQAASRLGAEQSAKLCMQYLAPIVKNRMYNFLPLGENIAVGAQARPNEITYSQDSLRPDFTPPPAPEVAPPADTAASGSDAAPLPAEATPTEPSAGLPGMMLPPGTGP